MKNIMVMKMMIKQMRIPVVKKKIRQENKSKKERMKIKI